MSEGPERRAARTESLFRATNEAIERGLWPGDEQDAVRFRCECARVDCHGVIELPVDEYEAVRRDPRQFLILPGHESPDLELVVARHDGYLVVEKQGAAGEEAELRDPRS